MFNNEFDNAEKSTRPVYAKRYKKNGEEYLKKIDEIDIEEDLKEKSLEINRIKEIFDVQERLKAEELLDDLTDEEYLEEIKDLQNIQELDTYEFLNKTEEIKELYNKMPEEVKMKYKDMAKFTKEYLPEFINKQTERLNEIKKETNKPTIEQTTENLEKQIKELQEKLIKGNETNVQPE